MARIIIAEDEESCRTILARNLKRQGHEVATAANGLELLQLTDHSPPDLVITDLNMPQMDGVEAIQRLRKRHPNLPVIAISGGCRSLEGPHLDSALSSGAARVLAKPFPFSDLALQVQEALARSRHPEATGDPSGKT